MGERANATSAVKSRWREEEAESLRGLDRLVYRSNKLGEDLTLTNTGGGNTSSKLMEKDPLTGADVEVLWVKGSGGDLRTAKRDGFASLYLEKVRSMKALYLGHPRRGPKTEIEDAMYPMYSHCVFNLNPRACSIDTPLHTLVPFKHVDHLHPNAVIAVAASVNQEKLTREIYGDDVLYVPWQRPGFDIGLLIERLIKVHPKARGIVLGHHGMSSWSDDDKTCYDTALEIVDRAARYIDAHDKGEKTFGGRRHAALPDVNGAGPRRRSCPGCAAGSPRCAGWWARCRTTSGCCASWAATTGRGWPHWARRARTTSCGPRSARCSRTGIPRAETWRR